MPDDALVELTRSSHRRGAGRRAAVPADPELAALAQIAASLRDLPDENFQKRLKSDLQRRATMTYFDRCTRS